MPTARHDSEPDLPAAESAALLLRLLLAAVVECETLMLFVHRNSGQAILAAV